jgi:hypothetical protein
MAYWFLRSKSTFSGTVILMPKVASSSIRASFKAGGDCRYRRGHKAGNDLGSPLGICIREPLDRLRSATTDKRSWEAIKTKMSVPGNNALERILDMLEEGEPVHNHIAPQVDVLNYRHTERHENTHCPVHNQGDELLFTPDYVFVYEQLPEAWDELLKFIDHKKIPLLWENKRSREMPASLEKLAPRIKKLYAKDIAMYEKYAAPKG